MKGPLQVIRRRSPAPPVEGDAPTTASAGLDPSDAPTAPAGLDPASPPQPSFATRGRLRRRLRYLRRVRELGLRDLGGLVFDQHRFAQANPELVAGKLAALSAVDAELRALERTLDRQRTLVELHEPGISACPRCGALHGSDARFCPSCGVPLRGPRAMAGIGESVSDAVGEIGPLSLPGQAPSVAQEPEPAAEPQPTVAMAPVPEPTAPASSESPSTAGEDASEPARP